MEALAINNYKLPIREYKGQRVVTFKDYACDSSVELEKRFPNLYFAW